MRFRLPWLLWHAIKNDLSDEEWAEETAKFEAMPRWFFWLQRDRDKW